MVCVSRCCCVAVLHRGITVKAQTASLLHSHEGEEYLLNLIDTPGHVDFGYEVSCSLGACQGALLVVDASQGVQAQTLANFFLVSTPPLCSLACVCARWWRRVSCGGCVEASCVSTGR